MKKIFILPFVLSATNAFGAFSFDNYTPTLDRLYQRGQSPIQSGYELYFDMPDYDKNTPSTIKYSFEIKGADINPVSGNLTGYIRNRKDYPMPISSWTNEVYVDFISNRVTSHDQNAAVKGGALRNTSRIQKLYGDFINNSIDTEATSALGGALYSAPGSNSDWGAIESITGNFIGNYINGASAGQGGAIYSSVSNYNIPVSINKITANFIDNYINAQQNAWGGAIYFGGYGGEINGDFIGNHVDSWGAAGGAIYYKSDDAVISSILSDFIHNYAAATGSAMGGAIYNVGEIESISGNFINNYAISEEGTALGGAIYSERDLNFLADNKDYRFSGNYTRSAQTENANAIYMGGANDKAIKFNLVNGGSYTFEDKIDGENPYDINIVGDGTGTLYIHNYITNAKNVNISNGILKFDRGNYETVGFVTDGNYPTMTLNNGVFDIANAYIESVHLNSLISQNNSYIHLNVDPTKMRADMLTIEGDVIGNNKLIIHALKDSDIRNMGDILFAQASGNGAANSFSVFRVFGSPYLYDIHFNDNGIKQWSLAMNNTKNPDFESSGDDEKPDTKPDPTPEPDWNLPTPGYTHPEIVAYTSMQNVMLDQTRGATDNAFGAPKGSGIWIMPVYTQIQNDNIAETKSKIFGGDFGYNKSLGENWSMGVMGSIREAKHKFSGITTTIVAQEGSEIDGHSQLFGGYLRYSPNNLNLFASIYGGLLQSEAKTYDGAMTDFDGTTLGGSLKAQYEINIGSGFSVAPIVGITYSQLNINNLTDVFGTTIEYDDVSQLVADLGITLKETIGAFSVFVRPSYLITMTDGNNVNIGGIGNIKSVKDLNIAQIEGGFGANMGKSFDFYMTAKYGTASDYTNIGFNFGLGYKF